MEVWVDVMLPFEKYLLSFPFYSFTVFEIIFLWFFSHYFFTFVPSSFFRLFLSNVPYSILLLIWTAYISARGDRNEEMIHMYVIHMTLYVIIHNLDVYMCIYRPWGGLSEEAGESSTDFIPLVFRLKVSSHSLLAAIVSITLLYNVKKNSFCLDGSRFSAQLIPVCPSYSSCWLNCWVLIVVEKL